MGTSLCVTPIKGRVIRVIKLDTCGNVITGASGAVVVADGFISVKPSPQYEDGTEFTKKRADGQLCVNQKDPGQLKRVSLDILMCVLDPDMRVIMDGARLLQTSGTTGTGAFFNDALLSSRFSLEIWQNVSGRNACNAAGQQQYVYWAFPNVGNAQVQDFTIGNEALEWNETAETMSVGQGAVAPIATWGGFPTASPPSSYLSSGAFTAGDHYAYNVTTVAPPTATCGASTVT